MRLLNDAAEAAGVDLVAVGPVDVAIPSERAGCRTPDIALIPGELTEGGYELLVGDDVILAVEVTGKDAITRDTITKPPVYARIGIPYYWVVRIDGPEPFVTAYRRADDRYEEMVTVAAGESVTLTEPFPVTVEPSKLTRRRP